MTKDFLNDVARPMLPERLLEALGAITVCFFVPFCFLMCSILLDKGQDIIEPLVVAWGVVGCVAGIIYLLFLIAQFILARVHVRSYGSDLTSTDKFLSSRLLPAKWRWLYVFFWSHTESVHTIHDDAQLTNLLSIFQCWHACLIVLWACMLAYPFVALGVFCVVWASWFVVVGLFLVIWPIARTCSSAHRMMFKSMSCGNKLFAVFIGVIATGIGGCFLVGNVLMLILVGRHLVNVLAINLLWLSFATATACTSVLAVKHTYEQDTRNRDDTDFRQSLLIVLFVLCHFTTSFTLACLNLNFHYSFSWLVILMPFTITTFLLAVYAIDKDHAEWSKLNLDEIGSLNTRSDDSIGSRLSESQRYELQEVASNMARLLHNLEIPARQAAIRLYHQLYPKPQPDAAPQQEEKRKPTFRELFF